MKNRLPTVLVHGGAGRKLRRSGQVLAGCADAAAAAWDILSRGGSALDAVQIAVTNLENNPLFNAGTGSVLNSDGRVEMDAAIMDGDTLRAGAVAAIGRIKNPVILARHVLEEGRHVLLVGAGAMKYARQIGMPRCSERSLVVARELRRWQRAQGTVGAVAADVDGRVAAATSTGGMFGKRPGRVGDSPLIGCGTFADALGAASCTGVGEAIIRVVLGKTAVDLLHKNIHPRLAAKRAVATLERATGAEGGVILVDARGRLGYAHNAASMPVCAIAGKQGRVTSQI